MDELAVLAVKALNGGVLVVVFALIGEMLEPKRFAGLFSAAPSVALASFTVVLVSEGRAAGQDNAVGMAVGAVAFVAFALVARPLMRRFDALRASAVACVVWVVVAGAGYLAVLR